MRITLLFFSLVLTASVIAQAPTNSDARKINPNGEISNAQRYQLDYELVDYTFVNGDSTILDVLNLAEMEYLRHDTMDQVYRDQEHEVAVLLYSRRRIHGTSPTLHK